MKRIFQILFMAVAVMSISVSCTESTNEPKKPDTPVTPEDPDTPVTPEDGDFVKAGLPADSKPEATNFFRRVLLIDHTGTGCGYCPYVSASLFKIEKETPADANKFVVIASHAYNSNDPMICMLSSKFKSDLKVSGFPHLNYDLRTTADATQDGAITNIKNQVSTINSKVKALAQKYPAKVGITAKAEVEGSKVKVTAGFKFNTLGYYKVGLILVESGIKASQSGSVSGVTGFDKNTHSHALRAGNATSSKGVMIGETAFATGNTFVGTYEIAIPSKVKIDNCSVVIYVTAPDVEGSAKYYVTNATSVKVGSSVAIEYAE